MKEIQFVTEIHASKERVWSTLWEDATFRIWSNFIDEGTYMLGELIEGHEVQFLSAGGYGVTSLIEKLDPSRFISIRHKADTQEHGQQLREDEWTGGSESYALSEHEGVTTLLVKMDLPEELEEIFNSCFPKALACLKTMAEEKSA